MTARQGSSRVAGQTKHIADSLVSLAPRHDLAAAEDRTALDRDPHPQPVGRIRSTTRFNSLSAPLAESIYERRTRTASTWLWRVM